MSRRITASTGGIRLATNLLENPGDLDVVRSVMEVKGKALDRNQQNLCDILTDMLTSPDFGDLGRLRTVIGQVRTSMENSIPGAGHSYAARAAAASLTPAAAWREEWSGMTQTRAIQNASDLDDRGLAELAERFKKIAAELLVAGRANLAVTAEATAQESITEPLTALLEALPGHTCTSARKPGDFTSKSCSIGWYYNVPVAYVSRVFRTVAYTHPDAPALMVLAKLLRADFLHREIREKGGAYGGMAGYNADGGLFSMLSYRDPHLERTLTVFEQAIAWACRGGFSDEMVKQSVLTAFAELDRPLSPGGRGYREFVHQQQGVSREMIQAFRNSMLAVDQKQLTRVAQAYLEQGFASSSVGILAGDEMFSKAQGALAKMNMQMKRLGDRST